MSSLTPMGDLALRFALPAGTSRRSLLAALRAAPAVVDAVLAEHVGLVTYSASARRSEAEQAVRAALARGAVDAETPPRRHRIEVVYDGEDLEEIGRRTGLGRAGVASLHASAEYEVAMLGFLPGFAYLRGLPEALVLPRRASPRPRVPAGALAMAAEYTGIYPFASPGGWHLLGHAGASSVFSATAGARMALGDAVSLLPVGALPVEARPPHAAGIVPSPALVVLKALGPALVVDGGRAGRMHEGVPPGGPLVRSAMAAANLAVGNGAAAPAVEIHGRLEVVARVAVRVADDSGRVAELAPGDAFEVAPRGRARCVYLAVAGGLDVPPVLGGAGTLLVAALGGVEGRPLRKGDALAVRSGARPEDAPAGGETWEPAAAAVRAEEEEVLVFPGPDLDEAALGALLTGTFRISPTSDRTGTRLEGPPLPDEASGARRSSTPMVEGAIERTPAGFIVLGPDHPTTGGYPVVAVVAARSRAALFARPPFAAVRFGLAQAMLPSSP